MIIIFLYFYILLFYTEVCERTVLTEATYICQKSFFFFYKTMIRLFLTNTQFICKSCFDIVKSNRITEKNYVLPEYNSHELSPHLFAVLSSHTVCGFFFRME